MGLFAEVFEEVRIDGLIDKSFDKYFITTSTGFNQIDCGIKTIAASARATDMIGTVGGKRPRHCVGAEVGKLVGVDEGTTLG